jgi:succinoglycan biosynthesis transport protein ExoP
MPPVGQPVVDLRQYGSILWARRWLIAALTLLVGLGTWVWTIQQTATYAAEAKVLVLPLQDPLTSLVPINTGLSQPNLNTEIQIIDSNEVAQRVQTSLGVSTPVDTLLRNLDASAITDTEVVAIRYSDRDPETAADLANAFADAYLAQRTQHAQDVVGRVEATVRETIAPLRTKVANLTDEIGATADPTAQRVLQARLDVLLARLQPLNQYLLDLQASSSGAQGGQIVREATEPKAAANIHLVRDVVLGLLAGFILGVATAFVVEGLDNRFKTRDDIERRVGPLIGAIPRERRGRKIKGRNAPIVERDPKSPASEAYRALAASTRQAASRKNLKVIAVTSALSGEGKTTTAANLAVALAQGGRSVVLVSADLRHPTMHEEFGVENDTGLSDVLSNGARFADVSVNTAVPGLRVVRSGPIPDDPAALLAGDKVAPFLADVGADADFVILDTPPVLPVADTSILLPACDGTVLVFDARRSDRETVVKGREQIEAAGGMLVGVVYANFDPRSSRVAGIPTSYY